MPATAWKRNFRQRSRAQAIRLLMIVAALAGLFAMHGLSDHGVADHLISDASGPASMLAGSPHEMAGTATRLHRSMGSAPATDSGEPRAAVRIPSLRVQTASRTVHTVASRAKAAFTNEGGDGLNAGHAPEHDDLMGLCFAVLAAAAIVLVSVWWLRQQLGRVSARSRSSWTSATLFAKARDPVPPGFRMLSVQRC